MLPSYLKESIRKDKGITYLKTFENYQYALNYFFIRLIGEEWNILASQMLEEIKSSSPGKNNWKLAANAKTSDVYNGQGFGRN
jgi:hypothetical protein